MRRRTFLRAAPVVSAGRILGAGERVTMGLIGCGSRGRYVARLMREAGAEFAAFADVYLPNARRAQQEAGGGRVFQDFRRLLEIAQIQAVVVATPDHWHAIPTVLACQAGKDVYVEKPLAHNIREGRAMVEGARRSGRIVAAGTQHRSAAHLAEAARTVRSGELGEVRFVRVWNYANLHPAGIGREPDSSPPEELDWEFYLGPAPLVPFNRKRFLGTYRWFWDYAGGYITDFGTHRFDTVHQIMGAGGPRAVSAAGGRFTLRDAGETPDILQVTYEYPGFVLSYEACNLNAHGVGGRTPGMSYYNARGADDRPHGMAFYGTEGALFADRIGYEIYPERKPGSGEPRIPARRINGPEPTPQHARDFLEAVRSRRPPAADVEDAHRATIVAHLGNIAFKLGRKLRWDAARETFPDDSDAAGLLGRQARKPWDLI